MKSRGLTLHTQTNLAALTQNEDAADQRDLDREFASITQQIQIKQKTIDLKMKLAEALPTGAASVYCEINVLVKEVEKLTKKMDKVGSTKRKKNKLVEELLSQAEESFFGVKRAKGSEKDGVGANNESESKDHSEAEEDEED